MASSSIQSNGAGPTLAVDGIGNLTLVSARLNPSLSNGPWSGAVGACKRDGLEEHSRLELNRRPLVGDGDWDEERIRRRAADLFEEARDVWPSAPPVLEPSTFLAIALHRAHRP